tara:strand:+ start:1571 stop:1939 length:369 start_codon:yes stop_codon:yes gene_type:complete
MKRALLSLLIAPDDEMREAILSGEKEITIREGHRDYTLGPVTITCHIEPWCVAADITNVRHTKLKELTIEECEAEGYSNWNEAVRDLRKYYPKIDLESNVTVIRWDNVHGKLVDDYLENDED